MSGILQKFRVMVRFAARSVKIGNIMDSNDLEAYDFFTTNGKDIWKMLYSCISPSCCLKNLETGVEESFGMGGLAAQRFHRIKMPKIVSVGEPPVLVKIGR